MLIKLFAVVALIRYSRQFICMKGKGIEVLRSRMTNAHETDSASPNYTKMFDRTEITNRLKTVSWSDNSHPIIQTCTAMIFASR